MPPKYQVIAEQLRAHIESGKYLNSTILPTEFLLAQEYQVSRQTVRQALGVLVKDKVIEKRQGSGSHILRQNLVPEPAQHHSVAVVTTYISDYIFPGILREAENIFSTYNCTPSLFATQNEVSNERRVLKNLLTMPVDGILVEGTKTALPNPNLDLYQQIIDKGIPLVFFHGNYINLPGALSVLDDNFEGGRMLVEYLHGKGHRNIAGIFKSDDIQGHQRYAGYATTLRSLDLPMEDKQLFWYTTEMKEMLLSGGASDLIDRVLKNATAVVCYNDEVANYLVNYLTKKGVNIPAEMAVVSFDNSWHSELSPVRITSLSHGKYNVGKMAADLLLHLLQGKEGHSQKAPWFLVEKESS